MLAIERRRRHGGAPDRARSTSRAVSATAPRIARAVIVAPATKSGGSGDRAAAQRPAGFARQERIELRRRTASSR